MNRSDGALTAYAVTGRDEAFEDFRTGTIRVRRALAAAAAAADDDPQESAAVADQRRLFARWSDLVDSAVAAPTPAGRRTHLPRRHAGPSRGARRLRRRERAAAGPPGRPGRRRGPPRVVGPRRCSSSRSASCSARAAMVAGYRARSAERRATSRRRLQGRFGEAIQASDSQAEAHRLLKTHLERTIPGLDHHRPEPQQQRRPSRGEHAAHRGLAARRGSRGGPPALLHGGAAEPLVQPGRGGRRGPVVRAVRRVAVRHHLPAAARRRRGHRRGARRAPAVPAARGPRADRRLGRPGLARRWPTCATSRSPRRARPPMR